MNKTGSLALAVVISLGLYLVITSAFYPLGFLSVFDAKRVLQLALFAAIMIFATAWAPLRIATCAQLGRLSVMNRYALGLFFLIGVISSLRLEHPAYALADVSMLFVMMILIAVTAASRELSGGRFDRWAVLLLVAMGFAVAVQEFMGFVSGWIFGFEFDFNFAFVHFAHPRFYNQLQTWSIPILAAIPVLFPTRRWVKFTCIFLLGMQWFLIIAVAARGTFVGLVVAMLFVALWLPEQRKFWLKFQLAGLFAGIVIYAGVLFANGVLIPQSKLGNFYANSAGRSMVHTSGRSTLWRFSVEDAIKHPILGSGPTRYACDSEKTLPAHPHSFPLTIMGEWGLIAFFLFLIISMRIGFSFLKHLKSSDKASQTDSPLNAMLAISLIAGVIHACVSGLLIMPASQVAMILIAGWTLSISGSTPLQPTRQYIAGTLSVTGLFISIAMLLFATTELNYLHDRTSYSNHYGPMFPRFWQDGRVCEYRYNVLPLQSE